MLKKIEEGRKGSDCDRGFNAKVGDEKTEKRLANGVYYLGGMKMLLGYKNENGHL